MNRIKIGYYVIKCLFGVLFLLSTLQTQAQDTTRVSRDTIRISISKQFRSNLNRAKSSTEFGLNVSALMIQMIPFLNRETSKTGPFGFSLKVFTNNDAFRLGMGTRLTSNNQFLGAQFDQKEDYFNLRMGYEHRYRLSKRILYSFGGDAVFVWGSFNAPVAGFGGSNNSTPNLLGTMPFTLGLAGFAGIEYEILPRLSISTESMLFIGAGQINFAVVPPVSIFLNAKL